MKTIGLIGCETDFILDLLTALEEHGLRVAALRESDADIRAFTTAETTSRIPQLVLRGDVQTILLLKGPRAFDEIVGWFDADILLVEGFDERRTFPRLLCSGTNIARDALTGLELCAVGDAPSDLGIPVLTDISEIAELVRRCAFGLAGLNCGKCGFSSCYDLAREIVRGDRSEKDCLALRPEIEITIGGTPLPLIPFVSQLIRNVILGILSSLKGIGPGTVEIRIEQE